MLLYLYCMMLSGRRSTIDHTLLLFQTKNEMGREKEPKKKYLAKLTQLMVLGAYICIANNKYGVLMVRRRRNDPTIFNISKGKDRGKKQRALEPWTRTTISNIQMVDWCCIVSASSTFFVLLLWDDSPKKNTQAQQEQEQTDKLNKQFGLIYIGYVGSNAPNNIAIHRISGDNL